MTHYVRIRFPKTKTAHVVECRQFHCCCTGVPAIHPADRTLCGRVVPDNYTPADRDDRPCFKCQEIYFGGHS